MTKLVIGKDGEKEPEIRFWLEPFGDVIRLMARGDKSQQIIADIRPDGKINAVTICEPQLTEFFGARRPFANLS